MRKWAKLREAARGDSEELQRLLDTGEYDVNEGNETTVCEKTETHREREVLTDSSFLLISTLWIVCHESQWVCIEISCDVICDIYVCVLIVLIDSSPLCVRERPQ